MTGHDGAPKEMHVTQTMSSNSIFFSFARTRPEKGRPGTLSPDQVDPHHHNNSYEYTSGCVRAFASPEKKIQHPEIIHLGLV